MIELSIHIDAKELIALGVVALIGFTMFWFVAWQIFNHRRERQIEWEKLMREKGCG